MDLLKIIHIFFSNLQSVFSFLCWAVLPKLFGRKSHLPHRKSHFLWFFLPPQKFIPPDLFYCIFTHKWWWKFQFLILKIFSKFISIFLLSKKNHTIQNLITHFPQKSHRLWYITLSENTEFLCVSFIK